MNNVNCFTDSFESIPDCKKIVSIMFLIKNDVSFFIRMWFFKR